MIKNLQKIFKSIRYFYGKVNELGIVRPTFKIASILEDKKGLYVIVVQIINSNATFNMKPEEILTNDYMVDRFSPRDIRAMTYLGYITKNLPQYQILAQKILENGSNTIIIKKTNSDNIITVSAKDIANNKEIISKMSPEDAFLLGYSQAQAQEQGKNIDKSIYKE